MLITVRVLTIFTTKEHEEQHKGHKGVSLIKHYPFSHRSALRQLEKALRAEIVVRALVFGNGNHFQQILTACPVPNGAALPHNSSPMRPRIVMVACCFDFSILLPALHRQVFQPITAYGVNKSTGQPGVGNQRNIEIHGSTADGVIVAQFL